MKGLNSFKLRTIFGQELDLFHGKPIMVLHFLFSDCYCLYLKCVVYLRKFLAEQFRGQSSGIQGLTAVVVSHLPILHLCHYHYRLWFLDPLTCMMYLLYVSLVTDDTEDTDTKIITAASTGSGNCLSKDKASKLNY